MARPEIVVGVDGSPESRDALRWAFNYACSVDGTLRVIYAWEPPTVANLNLPPIRMNWEPLVEHARAVPGEIVREVLGERANGRVIPMLVKGGAAQALVDASRHADLLVVGSQGLGGLKGMILGSIGHHCAAHAECPVVIYRTRKPPRRVRRELPKSIREHS
jgi:nucleotide-binding universal stress UspA family protein